MGLAALHIEWSVRVASATLGLQASSEMQYHRNAFADDDTHNSRDAVAPTYLNILLQV
jgi:hypothetical protein